MFDIKKVFFNQTVHWVGLGPITEIGEAQFRDAMWVENMPGFAFEHTSGEITWVPASNIRWVQAVIIEGQKQSGSKLSTVEEPEAPSDNTDAPKKRGRPKRSDIH